MSVEVFYLHIDNLLYHCLIFSIKLWNFLELRFYKSKHIYSHFYIDSISNENWNTLGEIKCRKEVFPWSLIRLINDLELWSTDDFNLAKRPLIPSYGCKKQGACVYGPCHSPQETDTHAPIKHPFLGRIFCLPRLFKPSFGVADWDVPCGQTLSYLYCFWDSWPYLVVTHTPWRHMPPKYPCYLI